MGEVCGVDGGDLCVCYVGFDWGVGLLGVECALLEGGKGWCCSDLS